MLTREQIVCALKGDEGLKEVTHYTVCKDGQATICAQEPMCVLEKEFDLEDLKKAEKEGVFARVHGKAFYSDESTIIPGALPSIVVPGSSGSVYIPGA